MVWSSGDMQDTDDRVRRAEIQMWISMVYSVIPHVSPAFSSDVRERKELTRDARNPGLRSAPCVFLLSIHTSDFTGSRTVSDPVTRYPSTSLIHLHDDPIPTTIHPPIFTPGSEKPGFFSPI